MPKRTFDPTITASMKTACADSHSDNVKMIDGCVEKRLITCKIHQKML